MEAPSLAGSSGFGRSPMEVYGRQKEYHPAVRLTDATARIAKLKAFRAKILERSDDIKAAILADFGRSGPEADILEMIPTLLEINHMIRNLRGWMRPHRVRAPIALLGTRSEIRYEPRGVVLIIGPWNYPFYLVAAPVAAAIAAGNCVIVKPSELTPRTSTLMQEILRDTFDDREVAVFQGGPEITQELLKIPFDHIFFTGSTKVGRIVMEAAAKNLTSVTLELGGKSPAIVDETADVGKAARRVAWGKFVNAGQTCIAPDYVLVHESKKAQFLDGLREAIAETYGRDEGARQENKDFCRIINDRNFQRLKSLYDGTISRGAKLEAGGQFDAAQRYIAPTVVSGVTADAPLMSEEIFGPILPVITYRTLDSDVFPMLRGGDKPLSLYIFSESRANTETILRNTSAGGTTVNNSLIHITNPELPFGGTGASGMGNYHGVYGFRAFSHERAVLTQSRPDLLRLFRPPYSSRVRALIKIIVRYFT